MQQLGLRAEGARASAPPQQIVKPAQSRFTILLLLLSPVVLVFLTFIYYSLSAELNSWATVISTFSLISVMLLASQFLSGLLNSIQITLSAIRTRKNSISRRLASSFMLVDSPKVQPVSIIVWSQNQAQGLAETLKSLLALNYPDYEIIVINDGSNDATFEVLELEFGLQPLNRVFRRLLPTGPISAIYTSPKYPILTVVEKPRAGRADSLNIGLNLAKAPLVCVVEPGHLLSHEALLLLAKPFIEQPANTLMSASTGEPHAEKDNVLTFFENVTLVEKKRLFHTSYFEREAFCLVNATINAVRMIRKPELIELGGFQGDNDDLAINLGLNGKYKDRNYRSVFIPDIICWRREIETVDWYRHWQTAIQGAIVNNFGLILPTRLGKRWPVFIILLLDTISPIVKLLGALFLPIAFLLGAINLELLLLYFLTLAVFALMSSLGGLIADEFSMRYRHSLAEIVTLILASFVESILYRPVTLANRVRGALDSFYSNS